jgi:hypothetical protein
MSLSGGRAFSRLLMLKVERPHFASVYFRNGSLCKALHNDPYA